MLVAAKEITGAGIADPFADAEFEHEARMLTQINHPRVLWVYGFITKVVEGAVDQSPWASAKASLTIIRVECDDSSSRITRQTEVWQRPSRMGASRKLRHWTGLRRRQAACTCCTGGDSCIVMSSREIFFSIKTKRLSLQILARQKCSHATRETSASRLWYRVPDRFRVLCRSGADLNI